MRTLAFSRFWLFTVATFLGCSDGEDPADRRSSVDPGAAGATANGGADNDAGTGAGGDAGGAGTDGTGANVGQGGTNTPPMAGRGGEGGVMPPGGSTGGEQGGTGITCADDILITTEAELAEFAALECEVLGGTLSINAATLRNLDALRPGRLRVITENLEFIYNDSLENIQGLAGLERIRGGLTFVSNPLLVGLEGLESIESIGGDPSVHGIAFIDNGSLVSLAALGANANQSLELHASVMVSDNSALVSLEGLRGLETAQHVMIASNQSLVEMGGGLADLRGSADVTVIRNSALKNCVFPLLGWAAGITIAQNGELESVSVPSLSTVMALVVAENPVLGSLGTLDQLTSVESMIITNNAMLPQCFVDALDARFTACGLCTGNDVTATCD